MTGVLVSEIMKTGFITLISSKTLKVMGKKDFADIIAASGLCACGVYGAQIVIPAANKVKAFIDSISAVFGSIDAFFDKVNNIGSTIKSFVW